MSGERCCRGAASRPSGRWTPGWSCSATATTSRCSASVRPGKTCTCRRRWRWPLRTACRRWRRTTCGSCSPPISKRTRRACASTRARLLADPSRPRRYTPQQFLRTAEQMAAQFPGGARGAGQQRGDRAALQPGAAPRRGSAAGVSGAAGLDPGAVPATGRTAGPAGSPGGRAARGDRTRSVTGCDSSRSWP